MYTELQQIAAFIAAGKVTTCPTRTARGYRGQKSHRTPKASRIILEAFAHKDDVRPVCEATQPVMTASAVRPVTQDQRYFIVSERTQGDNWHYVCDRRTGGIVDRYIDAGEAVEACLALNDGREVIRFPKASGYVSQAAREIGGAL